MKDHIQTLVKVDLTHNILPIYVPAVRFSVKDKVIDIKCILEKRFGTKAGMMTIVLQNENKEEICRLDDDYQNLEYYGVRNG